MIIIHIIIIVIIIILITSVGSTAALAQKWTADGCVMPPLSSSSS